MAEIPLSFMLVCYLGADDIEAAVRGSVEPLARTGFPEPSAIRIPSNEPPAAGGFAEALRELQTLEESPSSVSFDLGERMVLTLLREPSASPPLCCLRLMQYTDGVSREQLTTFLGRCAVLCAHLLEAEAVSWAYLIREPGNVMGVPDLPLVHVGSYLTIVSEDNVHKTYEQPEVFWKAGWDSVEHYGERFLLLRGLDKIAGSEYLTHIRPHQWAMARAAKPGLTSYYQPQLQPEQRPVFTSGQPQLELVGYLEQDQVVEYSCAASPGIHIQGWEIFDIWALLEDGALPDGRKVETVRVVFLEQATAEQEKRPLLDLGAHVLYYDQAGDLVEIDQ